MFWLRADSRLQGGKHEGDNCQDIVDSIYCHDIVDPKLSDTV